MFIRDRAKVPNLTWHVIRGRFFFFKFTYYEFVMPIIIKNSTKFLIGPVSIHNNPKQT